MAGPIDYVSFPHFTRKRKYSFSNLPRTCLQLTKALLGLTGVTRTKKPDILSNMPRQNGFPHDHRRSWLMPRRRSSSEQHTLTPTTTPTTETANVSFVSHNDDCKRQASIGSLHGMRIKLKETFKRRMSVFCRPGSTSQTNCPGISTPIAMPNKARRSDDTLVAHLDAISLSESDLELLRRMEQVCHTARVARERRQTYNYPHILPIAAGQRPEAESHHSTGPVFDLHLRGGGGDEPSSFPFAGRRRRTTLPYPSTPVPLEDSARPNAVLWWLAGGRMSHKGKIPTIGELRVRREVEQANRSMVGFWGTVLGMRSVGTVGILPEGDGGADFEGTSVKSGGNDSGPGKAVGDARAAEDVVRSVTGSVKAPSGGGGSSRQLSKSSKSSKSGKSGIPSIGHGDVNDRIDNVVDGEATNRDRATSVRSVGKASSVSERAQEADGANETHGDAEAEANTIHAGAKKADDGGDHEAAR